MEEILKVTNLKKTLGKRVIIKDVSFQVNMGEIVGLVGLNGAGKTTIFKTILGLYKIDKGDITLFNYSIQKDNIKGIKRVGSMIESPSLYEHFTGAKNIKIFKALLKVKDDKYINTLIQAFQLEDAMKKKVKTYSLGMKTRLAILIALMNKPQFLILDEPTNGLDPVGIIEIRNLLLNLKNHHQISILISSHILSEMEQLCDRVLILKNGIITQEINIKDHKFGILEESILK